MREVDVSELNPCDMKSAGDIGKYMFRKKFSVLNFDSVCKHFGTISCLKKLYYFNVCDMWHQSVMLYTGMNKDGKKTLKEFIVFFIMGLRGVNMNEYFGGLKKRTYDESSFFRSALLISCLINGFSFWKLVE